MVTPLTTRDTILPSFSLFIARRVFVVVQWYTVKRGPLLAFNDVYLVALLL
jgi:hypothetical protein